MSLPNTYRRIEYLQSTNTQYIDTGIKTSGDLRIVLDSEWTYESGNKSLVGGRNSASSERFTLSGRSSGTNQIIMSYGTNGYNVPTSTLSPSNYGGKRNIFDANKNVWKIIIDDETIVEHTFTYSSFTGSYNVLICGITSGSTTGTNLVTLKVYGCKIYDNNTLVRDFIPAERKSDNVLGLYDLANDVFYTNAGSGTFISGGYVPYVSGIVNPNGAGYISGLGYYVTGETATLEAIAYGGYEFDNWLLKGYTQLEYIESTGTQYIDTGFVPNQDTKVDTTFENALLTGHIFCARYNTGTASGARVFALAIDDSGFRSDYNYPRVYFDVMPQQNTIYRVVKDKNNAQLMFNGNTYNANGTYATFTCPNNLAIFCSNTNGAVANFVSMKLYSFKMWDNGTLIRDYIPVIRHSDGAIGLLDLCQMKFYGNSGTGVFIGGQPI